MLAFVLNLLILIVVFAILVAIIRYGLTELGADAQITKIVMLLLLLVFLLCVINLLFGHPMWGPVVVV